VNKKTLVKLRNGQTYKLSLGGKLVCKNDKKVYLYSAAGDFVDVTFNRRNRSPQAGFLNVIIKAKDPHGSFGLCASSKDARAGKGLFRKYLKDSNGPKEQECSTAALDKAYQQCKAVKCKDEDMDICAIDVCNGIPAQTARDVEKEVEKVEEEDDEGNTLDAEILRRRGSKRCSRDMTCTRKLCTKTTFRQTGAARPKVIGRRRFFSGRQKCRGGKCKAVVTVKQTPGICYSTGDPHFTGFNKRKWNWQGRGDFVLVKSRTLTVHTRTGKWNRASVNTKIAAKLDLDVVESIGFVGNSWLINKKKVVTLKRNKEYKLRSGAKIIYKGNRKTYLYTSQGDLVDCIFNSRKYINVIVRAKYSKGASGLCVSSRNVKAGKGLFRRYVKGDPGRKEQPCSRRDLKKALSKCKRAGVKKNDWDTCAIDVCNGLPPKAVRDVEKELKKIKQSPGRCSAWGDPHYTGFNKRKYDWQGKGDFVLLKSRTLTVHTRTSKWGRSRTSVNTKIAAKLNRNVVESIGFGGNTWVINKKKVVTLRRNKAYKLRSGAKMIYRGRRKTYLYTSQGDSVELLFNSRGFINIVVEAKYTKGAKGLCVSSRGVKAGRGLFRRYVKGSGGRKEKPCSSRRKKRKAMKECRRAGVKKNDLDLCAMDVCNGIPAKSVKRVENAMKR